MPLECLVVDDFAIAVFCAVPSSGRKRGLSEDPANSPLFDGSATSTGSGGKYVPGRNYTCIPNDQPLGCPIKLAPGSGGGCITGPLAKSAHLYDECILVLMIIQLDYESRSHSNHFHRRAAESAS